MWNGAKSPAGLQESVGFGSILEARRFGMEQKAPQGCKNAKMEMHWRPGEFGAEQKPRRAAGIVKFKHVCGVWDSEIPGGGSRI